MTARDDYPLIEGLIESFVIEPDETTQLRAALDEIDRLREIVKAFTREERGSWTSP